MKIARFYLDDINNISYGKLVNNRIYELQNDPIIGDKSYELSGEKFSSSEVKFLPPVTPPNIIAIGLNYSDHAEEAGLEIPDQPLIFAKATSSIIGPQDDIILPKKAPNQVDYEAELGVVVSKECKNVSPEEVDEYILGYTCVNDVTARDCQQRDGQWVRAKSFDTFCPVGPIIENELDPDNCNIVCRVNNEIRQKSNTANMIFSVEEIISYLSHNMTLLPGTLILTGTPAGVGLSYDTDKYLKAEDEVKVEISGIGVLENQVKKC